MRLFLIAVAVALCGAEARFLRRTERSYAGVVTGLTSSYALKGQAAPSVAEAEQKLTTARQQSQKAGAEATTASGNYAAAKDANKDAQTMQKLEALKGKARENLVVALRKVNEAVAAVDIAKVAAADDKVFEAAQKTAMKSIAKAAVKAAANTSPTDLVPYLTKPDASKAAPGALFSNLNGTSSGKMTGAAKEIVQAEQKVYRDAKKMAMKANANKFNAVSGNAVGGGAAGAASAGTGGNGSVGAGGNGTASGNAQGVSNGAAKVSFFTAYTKVVDDYKCSYQYKEVDASSLSACAGACEQEGISASRYQKGCTMFSYGQDSGCRIASCDAADALERGSRCGYHLEGAAGTLDGDTRAGACGVHTEKGTTLYRITQATSPLERTLPSLNNGDGPALWTTLTDQHISPICAASEYKGKLDGANSSASCLAAIGQKKGINYGVWRGDGKDQQSKGCHVCALTGRGIFSHWGYSQLEGATTFSLQETEPYWYDLKKNDSTKQNSVDILFKKNSEALMIKVVEGSASKVLGNWELDSSDLLLTWDKGLPLRLRTVDGGESWEEFSGTKWSGKMPKDLASMVKAAIAKVMQEIADNQITKAGEPTNYVYSGCRQPFKTDLDDFERRMDSTGMQMHLGMTLDKCFIKCAGQAKGVQGKRYFGIARGKWCFCSELKPGQLAAPEQCNSKCDGRPKDKRSEMCGGDFGVASLYTMIDCLPKSADEVAADVATDTKKLIDSFGVFEDQSCGDEEGNDTPVDGSEVMAASVEKCKAACWAAKGAEICHGFTYDPVKESCKFTIDAASGKITYRKGLACYWKKHSMGLSWSGQK